MIMKSWEYVMLFCHLECSVSLHLHLDQSRKKSTPVLFWSGTGVLCKPALKYALSPAQCVCVPGFVLIWANQQIRDSRSFPEVWLFCQEESLQHSAGHVEWHKAGGCVVEVDPKPVGGGRSITKHGLSCQGSQVDRPVVNWLTDLWLVAQGRALTQILTYIWSFCFFNPKDQIHRAIPFDMHNTGKSIMYRRIYDLLKLLMQSLYWDWDAIVNGTMLMKWLIS